MIQRFAATSFFILLFSFCSFSKSIEVKRYINYGELTTVDGNLFPNLAFNTSSTYLYQSSNIVVSVGDSLFINLVNNDSISHTIGVHGTSSFVGPIASGDSALLKLHFSVIGLHMLFDNEASGLSTYRGLTCMIHVQDKVYKSFYWNVHEYQSDWHVDMAAGKTIDWLTYDPDYFTINGNGNPDINNDTQARPIGRVGDTLTICIANTGRSHHSMHFHGYHTKIVYSSKFPNHVDRIKDTHPVYSMSTIILQLIPDKPGEFPVHDHNLVAVTGGGLYPNGMFLTMLISP